MISFVIPAYNEEAVLGRTLESVRIAAGASGRPHEVIVVDDASTDRTGEIARASGAQVVTVAHRQIAAVRNAGARVATGDVLVFLDADTVLPANTLEAALATIGDGAAGGGGDVEFDGTIPAYAAFPLALAKRLLRLLRMAPGCFIFCTREAFEATGGYDERLYASEECFMSRALARQGRFVILREPVITSGRKLRQYSAWQLFGTLGRLMLSGGRGCHRREGLDVWYEGRRERDVPEVDGIPAAERD